MLAHKSHFGHLGRIIYVYAANRSILREDRLQQLFDESITNPERHRKDKRGERMLWRLLTDNT